MSAGSVDVIGPYTLHLQNYDSQQEPNYSAERATIDVDKDGRSVMMLYPTRRFYPSNQESGTMVAISSTLREDLYVVYAGTNPDTNLPVIHAYLNPLVKWIWLGGCVVVLGTILALIAEPPGCARDVDCDGGSLRQFLEARIPREPRFPQGRNFREIRVPIMTKRRLLASDLRRVRGDRAGLVPLHVDAQKTDHAKMLGEKLMCMCGCGQILTQCNHINCPSSGPMLKELDAHVAKGESDDLIIQDFVQEYGEKVSERAARPRIQQLSRGIFPESHLSWGWESS